MIRHKSVVQILLQYSVNPDCSTSCGSAITNYLQRRMALHWARNLDQLDIISLLLQHSANTRFKEEILGPIPLHPIIIVVNTLLPPMRITIVFLVLQYYKTNTTTTKQNSYYKDDNSNNVNNKTAWDLIMDLDDNGRRHLSLALNYFQLPKQRGILLLLQK